MKQMEKEFATIKGTENASNGEAESRCEGPRLKWANACGEPATDESRTTSASRAWRLTAKWLSQAKQATKPDEAAAARWNIRFYDHPKATTPAEAQRKDAE